MELLYVVWSNTDYARHFKPYQQVSPYVKDVETRFGRFKDHKAVRLFNEMARSGGNWGFDAPPNWILHYGPPPKMELLDPLPESIVKRAGGSEKIEELISAFRSFAVESDFDGFFKEHAKFYREIEDEYVRQGRVRERWGGMVRYFGSTPGQVTVVLTPLRYLGNFGLKLPMSDGGSHYFQIDSPLDFCAGSFLFDSDHIGSTIFHEFGHCFENDAVISAPDKNAHADWLPLISESMQKEGYGGEGWDTVLCESVARAGEICLARAEGEIDLSEKKRKELVVRGWFWVPAMADRMMEFHADQGPNPTFESFVPYLLRVLDELEPITEKTPGYFRGTHLRNQ